MRLSKKSICLYFSQINADFNADLRRSNRLEIRTLQKSANSCLPKCFGTQAGICEYLPCEISLQDFYFAKNSQVPRETFEDFSDSLSTENS